MEVYSQISSNKLKSWGLFVIFAALIIVLGWFFGYWFTGDYSIGLVISVILMIVLTFVNYYKSDSIVISLSGAREANKKEHAYLKNTVEGLSIAAGIPCPKIYVVDDPATNAFATGRDPAHSAVVFTTGLIEKLNRQELEGVAAHEISHIKNYDTRLMVFAVTCVGLVILLSDIMMRSFIFGRGSGGDRKGGNAILIIIGLALVILAPIFAQLIKMAISRKREFLADASGALLTRYPPGLASALKKISSDSNELKHANKATSHLYISSPFKGKLNFIDNLFSTHPPVEERIKALEKM